MLQSLLTERYRLAQHRDTKEQRVYELTIEKAGLKTFAATTGPQFHGDMRHFADFLAVQLSIALPDDPRVPGRASGTPAPVLDKTGLSGSYDFPVDIKPEPGADMFTLWQRTLKEKLGLKLESRKAPVEVLVVDTANQLPAAN